MNVFFDYYNKFEMPAITLCNPDGAEILSLGEIYDRKLEIRYNALSKFKFVVPYEIDGEVNSAYDLCKYRKLVKVENIGTFMITKIDKNDDGIVKEKLVESSSYEVAINDKKISLFSGTYEFYDPVSPSETLIGTLLSYNPLFVPAKPSLRSFTKNQNILMLQCYVCTCW